MRILPNILSIKQSPVGLCDIYMRPIRTWKSDRFSIEHFNQNTEKLYPDIRSRHKYLWSALRWLTKEKPGHDRPGFFYLFNIWSVRLTARTQDFHSCNTGSIPVQITWFVGVTVTSRLSIWCHGFNSLTNRGIVEDERLNIENRTLNIEHWILNIQLKVWTSKNVQYSTLNFQGFTSLTLMVRSSMEDAPHF